MCVSVGACVWLCVCVCVCINIFTFAVSSIAYISSHTHTGSSCTLWTCYTAAAEDKPFNNYVTHRDESEGSDQLPPFCHIQSPAIFSVFHINKSHVETQTNNELTLLNKYRLCIWRVHYIVVYTDTNRYFISRSIRQLS